MSAAAAPFVLSVCARPDVTVFFTRPPCRKPGGTFSVAKTPRLSVLAQVAVLTHNLLELGPRQRGNLLTRPRSALRGGGG